MNVFEGGDKDRTPGTLIKLGDGKEYFVISGFACGGCAFEHNLTEFCLDANCSTPPVKFVDKLTYLKQQMRP